MKLFFAGVCLLFLLNFSLALDQIENADFQSDQYFEFITTRWSQTLDVRLKSQLFLPSSSPISSLLQQSDENIPDVEMDALEELYWATNGPAWVFPRDLGAAWNFTGINGIMQ